MEHRTAIPTHLKTPERIIGPFTPRALFLLLIGCALGFSLWGQSSHWLAWWGLGATLWPLRLLLAALPPLLACVLGVGAVAGRTLDSWCLVLLWALHTPRCTLWRSVCLQDRFALAPPRPQGKAQHVEGALTEEEEEEEQ